MGTKVPTILDNREGSKLLDALNTLLEHSRKLDIATGTFEVGSFLALDTHWQPLERLRILMGDETTRRTRSEIVAGLKEMTNGSIEGEKERDDSLQGLSAVRKAIADKKITIRVYSKAKFHAKAYLMTSKDGSPVDFAIVGSSNFTRPGITRNLELNLFSTDPTHIGELRKWYDELWKEARDVSSELLPIIELHLKEYDPFIVYAKALYEYFAGREKLQDHWEANDSVIYKMLSQYQKDGYHRALQIAEEWNGALICDGVGLGKTFIGLMLLERYIHDRKRVLMIVPKSAEKSVWASNINRFLVPSDRRAYRDLFDLRRHTDFGREGIINEDDLEHFEKDKDVIIIDEAHHFRNPNSNRGKLLKRLAAEKKLFLLTATPINNSLNDLYHLINYSAQDKPDYFARIGIMNLRRHFLDNEKRMTAISSEVEVAELVQKADFLRTDHLLTHLLIQRSRKYVKDSEGTEAGTPLFPVRQLPRVMSYSLKSVYETIYGEIKEAFDKDNPFLTLAIYNTTAYHKDPDKRKVQTQKQVIGLIRVLLLKRLESSFKAFEASVEDLLFKMTAFVKRYSPNLFEAWDKTNRRWWSIVQEHINKRLEREEAEEPEEEDEVPEEETEFDPNDHDMDQLIIDVQEDMKILTEFLSKIYRRFYVKGKEGEEEDPVRDNKVGKLVEALREDPLLKRNKVVIFSEFRDTARYLARRLEEEGFERVEEIDSTRKINREVVIKRFAPHYNCQNGNGSTQSEFDVYSDDPIDILISTDILAEGLNLQDASLIINYDLHWNPVRLMQRIGRVDRRLDPQIEKLIKRPAELTGKIFFWNFLPPKELDDLLHLRRRLDGKILQINKILGIEGALLTPDDPDATLKLFNERYEGQETIEELMNLERQNLETQVPEVWKELADLPRRLFSGKQRGAGFTEIKNRKGEPVANLEVNLTPGVFCCYRMPVAGIGSLGLEVPTGKGEVRWYFRDSNTGEIHETLNDIWTATRCAPHTPRNIEKGVVELAEVRKEMEEYIRNTYLKAINAPIGEKPVLLAWMEVV